MNGAAPASARDRGTAAPAMPAGRRGTPRSGSAALSPTPALF